MKAKAVVLIVSSVVIVVASGATYVILQRKKTCSGLISQSVVQMTSAERTEIRQIGNNPEELRNLLIDIHKEKLRYWTSRYEGSRKRMFDNYNEVVMDPSRSYSLEAAHDAAQEQFEAIDQIMGFEKAIAALKGYSAGMPEEKIAEIRSQASTWAKLLAQTNKETAMVSAEFSSRLRSKKPFIY